MSYFTAPINEVLDAMKDTNSPGKEPLRSVRLSVNLVAERSSGGCRRLHDLFGFLFVLGALWSVFRTFLQ